MQTRKLMKLVSLSFVLPQNFVINIYFINVALCILFLISFLDYEILVDSKRLSRVFHPWQLVQYLTVQCWNTLVHSSGWMSCRGILLRRA